MDKLEKLVLHKLNTIEKEIHRMTQVFDALTAEITVAINEIQTLVSEVQAIASGTSDAQVQPVLDKLTAAVNAAQSALAPAPTSAPVVAPAPTASPTATA